jgi:hypothetical protein
VCARVTIANPPVKSTCRHDRLIVDPGPSNHQKVTNMKPDPFQLRQRQPYRLDLVKDQLISSTFATLRPAAARASRRRRLRQARRHRRPRRARRDGLRPAANPAHRAPPARGPAGRPARHRRVAPLHGQRRRQGGLPAAPPNSSTPRPATAASSAFWCAAEKVRAVLLWHALAHNMARLWSLSPA